MPKRPGSPLEPETARKSSRFFTETKTTFEQSILSNGDALTDVRRLQSEEIVTEGPSDTNSFSMEERKNDQEIPLQQLLSLEGLNTLEEISARFHIIARELFSNYRIQIQHGDPKSNRAPIATTGGTREQPTCTELRLMEIEFYLISPNVHEDPYCHGSLEQARSGCWYFHRAPRRTESSTHTPSAGGGYRGGSRKGLDITIGAAAESTSGQLSTASRSEKPRGGILLRSARVVSTGAVISGPSLFVDFILQTCGAEDIKTLVSEKWEGNTSAFRSPVLGSSTSQLSFVRTSSESSTPDKTTKPITYYTTPRIGLDLGHATARPEPTNLRVTFVQRPYRFLVEPSLLKVNGRPQMFVGLLQHTEERLGIVSWPYSQMDKSRILQNIVTLGGFSASVARTYLQHYENGIQGGAKKLASFCGVQGVTQSAEKLLQMFGALRALSST